MCPCMCDQETPKREAKGPSWTIRALLVKRITSHVGPGGCGIERVLFAAWFLGSRVRIPRENVCFCFSMLCYPAIATG
jgi:hypothetical protein